MSKPFPSKVGALAWHPTYGLVEVLWCNVSMSDRRDLGHIWTSFRGVRWSRLRLQQHEFIETAMSGQVVSEILQGQRTFDLVLRLEDDARENLEVLRRLKPEERKLESPLPTPRLGVAEPDTAPGLRQDRPDIVNEADRPFFRNTRCGLK